LSSVRPILLIGDMALPGWRLRSITGSSGLLLTGAVYGLRLGHRFPVALRSTDIR